MESYTVFDGMRNGLVICYCFLFRVFPSHFDGCLIILLHDESGTACDYIRAGHGNAASGLGADMIKAVDTHVSTFRLVLTFTHHHCQCFLRWSQIRIQHGSNQSFLSCCCCHTTSSTSGYPCFTCECVAKPAAAGGRWSTSEFKS